MLGDEHIYLQPIFAKEAEKREKKTYTEADCLLAESSWILQAFRRIIFDRTGRVCDFLTEDQDDTFSSIGFTQKPPQRTE
jgi:hypothetical protein